MGNSDSSRQNCADRYEDFLLTEYENIAKAYFDVKISVSSFFRYYLLVMSVPISLIIAFFSKLESFTSIQIPNEFTYVCALAFVVLPIVGHFMTRYIISSGMNAKIYAEQVNAIREYFTLVHEEKGGRCYKSKLPTHSKDVKSNSNSLKYIYFSTMVINTFYFFVSAWIFFKSVDAAIVFALATIILQILSYCFLLAGWNNNVKKLCSS